IAVTLVGTSPSKFNHLKYFYYSNDAGKNWQLVDVENASIADPSLGKKPFFAIKLSCDRDAKQLKIQLFEPDEATVWYDCIPALIPTKHLKEPAIATTSIVSRSSELGDGLWLTTKKELMWVVHGEAQRVELPGNLFATIVQPHTNNRIIVA